MVNALVLFVTEERRSPVLTRKDIEMGKGEGRGYENG